MTDSAGSFSLSFSGLYAGYGKTPILRGIDGRAEQGSFTVLIGPNGSGKSTLLRVLAGLLPYAGSLRAGRRELSGFSRKEVGRTFGVTPQHTRVEAPFTVHEVLALGRLPWQGMTTRLSEEDRRRIALGAERLDITHLLFRRATRLSGGEAQRVALATVLVQDVPVMLLDEPGSAQDPLQARRVFSLMRSLAGEGRAVVAAVHDINVALPFADAFIALKEGRITASGKIDELDADVLRDLYGTPFEVYLSKGGKRAWHACTEDP